MAPDAVLDHTLPPGGTDFPSFSDWRIRTIVFPDVEAGDTVHYVLLLRSRRALFPGAYEATLTGGPLANVTAADIAITLPAAMDLAVAASGLDEDATVPEGSRVRRHWHLAAAPDGADGEVRLRVSTFASYAALGDAFAARALPAAAPSDAIGALADRLTAGLASRRAQAARLAAHVARRIRYVGIQYGAGRVVPDDAVTIARRGYGDCKDHVALLQALLAAKGIFSEPALISTKARYALPQPPTLALLDHVLLFIPEFDLYLDPTSPYSAFGSLPFEDYDKPVVLAGAGGARLARTPPLLPGAAATETRTEARITQDGRVIGSTVTSASGPAAVTLRQVAAGIEEDGGETTAADTLGRLGTPGHGDFDFASPRDTDGAAPRYALAAKFRLPRDTADTNGERFAVPAGLPVLLRGGAFLVSDKPVRDGRHLCYAGRAAETIHLLLPPGAAVGHLPRDVLAEGGTAHYRARYSVAAGRSPSGARSCSRRCSRSARAQNTTRSGRCCGRCGAIWMRNCRSARRRRSPRRRRRCHRRRADARAGMRGAVWPPAMRSGVRSSALSGRRELLSGKLETRRAPCQPESVDAGPKAHRDAPFRRTDERCGLRRRRARLHRDPVDHERHAIPRCRRLIPHACLRRPHCAGRCRVSPASEPRRAATANRRLRSASRAPGWRR